MKNPTMNLRLPKRLLPEFTAENLGRELLRLKNLFLPEFKIPNISICIGNKSYTKAAETYYTQNKIVVYRKYHENFPEDYKITLLHELGHIVADHSHGENFKKYYKLLYERQRSIVEPIIPSFYSNFLFCRISRHYTKKYFCPICRSQKIYRKRMSVSCKECEIPMLEDMFFEGIEAIMPPEFRASVDRSVRGVAGLNVEERIC